MNIKALLNVNSILVGLLLVAYVAGFHNLSVNTEFVGDESIAVVVGKMGLFHADWLTLAPQVWMPGEYHFYPSISAVTYSTFGLMGVRALSYIVSAFALVFLFGIAYNSTLSKRKSNKIFAGLITVSLVLISQTNYFLSRLGTADMLSAMLLLGGFTFLKLTENNSYKIAQKLLTAYLLFFLAFITKTFTLIFLPVVIAWVFYICVKNKDKIKDVFVYFLYPLLACVILYNYENIGYIVNFQAARILEPGVTAGGILSLFLQYSYFIAPIVLVGMFGMLLKNNLRLFFMFILMASTPIIFHIVSNHVIMLERHIFFTIAFLSLLGGIGVSDLFSYLRSKILLNTTKLVMITIVVFLGYFSYQDYLLNSHVDDLYNTTNVELFLINYTNENTKILTEIGSPITLALYEKNNPVNITTFDWLEYKGDSGYTAYEKALSEKYFDLIQVNGSRKVRLAERNRLIKLIKTHIVNGYELVYKEGDYYVYAKK